MKRPFMFRLMTRFSSPQWVTWGWVGVFFLLSTIALGGVAYRSASDVYRYKDTFTENVPLDAIVCLAGGRGRIRLASDIWFQYRSQDPIPTLYVSGMWEFADREVLAQQVRPEVLETLPLDQVVLETKSRNTFENTTWIAKEAAKRNWKNILLVTSNYHMKRAHYLLDRLMQRHFKHYQIYTLSYHQEPFSEGKWRTNWNGIRLTVSEYLKLVYFRLFF